MKYVSNLIFVGAAALCAARGLRGPGERGAWLLMGLGVLAWALGLFYYTFFQWDLETIPVPSLADAGYLLIYPPIWAALVLLYRSRIRGRSGALWIDGAIGALAVGAIGAAVVFDAVLDSVDGAGLAAATNLSYPIADVVMLGLVVGVLAMTGWRKAGAWGWIAGGLALFAISDSLYFYGIALGTYEEGVIYDAGWPARRAAPGVRRLDARDPAAGGSGRRAAPDPAPDRLRGGVARAAGLRPLRQHQRARPRARQRLSRGRARAARGHPRRQPQDARHQPRGGLHRRAHRARQPPLADARARARGRGGDGGAPRLPRDLRSGRLQGLQRRLRPSRRRLPADPPEQRPARVRQGPRRGLPDGRRRVLRARVARARRRRHGARGRRRGAQRARRRLHDHVLVRQGHAARRRPPAPSTPSTSRTSACTCRRTAAASRRGASRATCCCARWRSAIPRSGTTSTAWRSWPSRSASGSACCPRSSRTCARRRSCTTWARSPSPTRSSTSPARWTTTSGSSCAATRSSASASCRRRRRSSASPRSCARPTSAWTARATPTSWPARRSRSPPGSCSSATPTRR